ncbi:hypothetical protein [Mesorhizobium sp. M1322]|uniref:hypothetical protein n=1 Tax=Mesorhizobium sp. M1322 TaxID=2957081 RepID=UPI00333E0536
MSAAERNRYGRAKPATDHQDGGIDLGRLIAGDPPITVMVRGAQPAFTRLSGICEAGFVH